MLFSHYTLLGNLIPHRALSDNLHTAGFQMYSVWSGSLLSPYPRSHLLPQEHPVGISQAPRRANLVFPGPTLAKQSPPLPVLCAPWLDITIHLLASPRRFFSPTFRLSVSPVLSQACRFLSIPTEVWRKLVLCLLSVIRMFWLKLTCIL